jgi:hypothetical protein
MSQTPQKRQYISTRIHAITTQKITTLILTAVKTLNVEGGRYIQDSIYLFFLPICTYIFHRMTLGIT